jgi:hypothetical protein
LFDGNRGVEIAEMTADLMSAPSLDKLHRMENYLESLFIGNTLLYVTLFMAKISICLLYRRIFSTQQFRKMCLILMVVCTMWFIAAEVTNLCTCIPIDAFWHRTKPGKCLNFNIFSLIIGIFDILLDVCILLLPVRAVLFLQMPMRTKVMVLGIFLLGGFGIITNILRVVYQYQPNGYYVNFTKAETWSVIHAAVAILCACLPTYKPLRDVLGKFVFTIRDRYGSSVRFLRSGSGPARLGSSKNSTDGENGNHGLGNLEPKLYHPAHMGYHYPTKDTSSTRELVLTPPAHWGHQYGAGWHEVTAGNDQPVTVPPGAIARTTRVDVV